MRGVLRRPAVSRMLWRAALARALPAAGMLSVLRRAADDPVLALTKRRLLRLRRRRVLRRARVWRRALPRPGMRLGAAPIRAVRLSACVRACRLTSSVDLPSGAFLLPTAELGPGELT